MKPDKAVIYFTVSSGTGYGIIISLIAIFLNPGINLGLHAKLTILFLSFFLIISGLFASTIHLGHPMRAWRALSQWKSSWLSREGLSAVFTFFPLSLFFIFWIFNYNFNITFYLLILSATSSLVTVYCTGKIYSTLKSIPAWNNPLVPVIYVLNSLVLGSLITYTILFYFEFNIKVLSNLVITLCLTTLFIKLLYWQSIRGQSKSNIATATGLGNKNKTSFFEGPHSGKNFLTTEMINTIEKTKSLLLRITLCIFVYITPSYYIFQKNNLIVSEYVISITLVIISIISLIGMFIERYLFFIESKHTVSLYYGNKTI